MVDNNNNNDNSNNNDNNNNDNDNNNNGDGLYCIYGIGFNCLVVFALILIYLVILQMFLTTKKDDPLLNVYFPIVGSGWAMSHLIFFAILGYLYPSCFVEAMIAGTVWEIFEFSFSDLFPKFFPKLALQMEPNWSSWYFGSFRDIVVNFFGFLIGLYLSRFRAQ